MPGKPLILSGCLALALAAIVLATHWPALSAQAVFLDDQEYLGSTPFIQYPSWASVKQAFTEVLHPYIPGYYEPLHLLSLMVDYARGGRLGNLHAFHQTSLVLHVANTLLVAVLLYSLIRQPYVAVLVALLFGVHPQTVEPVALVAQRKVLLATFFCLCSLVFYVRYTRRRSGAAFAACLATFLLGLLSKPTITPLPVLMLLLDLWPLRRLDRRAILEKIPLFVIAGVSATITLIACSRTSGITLPGETSAAGLALTIPYLTWFYMSKAFWPVPVPAVYPLPAPLSLSNPVVLTGTLAACLLLVGVTVSLRWTRGILVGFLFFFIALFPTMNAVGYTWVAASDKHAYLPIIGLLIPIAYYLGRWWEGSGFVDAKHPKGDPASSGSSTKPAPLARRIAVSGVLILVAVGGAIGVRSYLRFWQKTELLLRRTIALTPDCPFPYNNLGVALFDQGRVEESIDQYLQALRIHPNYPQAHNNLGASLTAQGKIDAAIEQYRLAVQLKPDYAEAHFNLAHRLDGLGRLQEATEEYAIGLRIRQDASSHNNFAAVLADLGRFDEAVSHYRQALQLAPDAADVHNNLGEALADQGKPDEAIVEHREALRLRSPFPRAHHSLALALAEQGKTDEALYHFRLAIEQQADYPEAHYNLAKTLADRGDVEEAVHHYQEAIRLRPVYPAAQNNLGVIRLGQGRIEEAIEQLRAALAGDAGFTPARLNLADALIRQGRTDEAMVQYREVLRRDPQNDSARRQLQAITSSPASTSAPAQSG